ncbi:MAG: PilZ domain-containing protein [Proteobacteria bacterium]|nr:PilZ domain-containing protein [Pseudomonadota bacterium]
MTPSLERRKHPRYNVNSDVLAVLKPYPIKLGQIANISEGGLAFNYQGAQAIDGAYSFLDLIASQGQQHFSSFPIQPLRDTTVSKVFGKSIPIRQMAICFQALNSIQKVMLQQFIDIHTK